MAHTVCSDGQAERWEEELYGTHCVQAERWEEELYGTHCVLHCV